MRNLKKDKRQRREQINLGLLVSKNLDGREKTWKNSYTDKISKDQMEVHSRSLIIWIVRSRKSFDYQKKSKLMIFRNRLLPGIFSKNPNKHGIFYQSQYCKDYCNHFLIIKDLL